MTLDTAQSELALDLNATLSILSMTDVESSFDLHYSK